MHTPQTHTAHTHQQCHPLLMPILAASFTIFCFSSPRNPHRRQNVAAKIRNAKLRQTVAAVVARCGHRNRGLVENACGLHLIVLTNAMILSDLFDQC